MRLKARLLSGYFVIGYCAKDKGHYMDDFIFAMHDMGALIGWASLVVILLMSLIFISRVWTGSN
jgi:hypothetical protein